MDEINRNKVQNENSTDTSALIEVQNFKFKKKPFLEKVDNINVNETKLQEVLTRMENNTQLNFLKHLDLSNLELIIIPVDLIHLVCLTTLNVSYNFLKKVPDCIYNGLPRLQILDLSHNEIQEFYKPSCMLSLSVLNVNDNLLKIIPHWIWEYNCQLSELNINNNPINMKNYGIITKTAISVSRLKKLSISNCNLRNCDKDILRNIPYLVYLNIGNDIYGRNENCWDFDIFILQCRPQIQILLLQNLYISSLPDEIYELSSLKTIYLNKNIIYSLPEKFCSLHNLIICNLSDNQLTNLPYQFTDLINLEELYLANNLLSQLQSVNNFKKLKILDLYNNFLSYINMDQLCQLEGLDMEYNFLIVNNENYIEQKIKLRTKINELTRQDGSKEHEYASSNYSDSYQDNLFHYKSETDEYEETDVINNYFEYKLEENEENWEENFDDDYIPKCYHTSDVCNNSSDVCNKLSTIKQEENCNIYQNFVDAD